MLYPNAIARALRAARVFALVLPSLCACSKADGNNAGPNAPAGDDDDASVAPNDAAIDTSPAEDAGADTSVPPVDADVDAADASLDLPGWTLDWHDEFDEAQ